TMEYSMRFEFYGLAFDTPRVTVHLWSPWRAAAIEHRLFEVIRALPGARVEQGQDEMHIVLTDVKSTRAAVQSAERVLKGWQEEAAPGSERGSWRWMRGADPDANGYAHPGDRASLWFFLRLPLDRGGPGDPEKGEALKREGFGLQIGGSK